MKALDTLAVSTRQADVFRDFCEASFCAIAKTTTFDKARAEALELRFERVMAKHERMGPNVARDTMGRMLGELVLALEEKPHDFLGRTFAEIGLGNFKTGQFFTPDEVARMMAEMSLGGREGIEKLVAEKGYFTVHEPASGPGVMVIQMAEVLKAHGFNPAHCMRVTMVDIDPTCFQMAYLQVSLLGINAEVLHGNSLSLEMWDRAVTPVFMLHPWRHERRASVETPAPPAALPELPPPAIPAVSVPGPAQFDLFGKAAE